MSLNRHKYARIERERRFVLDRFPSGVTIVRTRRIEDRYIDGAMLRLREQIDESGAPVFKLTQKLPHKAAGAQQGLITTMDLAKAEFELLAMLPAKTLRKTRYSVPPFGIDVFDGALRGLILAEAEFDRPEAAEALTLPPCLRGEVTADDRFTGGRLVCASREELQTWLLEYGITLGSA